MAFDWYTPKTRATEDVKISGTTITITEAGLARLTEIDPAFHSAEYVSLGWDTQKSLLGMSPLHSAKTGAFKFGLRGRSKTSRTISAARFFEAFGITPLARIIHEWPQRFLSGPDSADVVSV
jgi:hypothetical protein